MTKAAISRLLRRKLKGNIQEEQIQALRDTYVTLEDGRSILHIGKELQPAHYLAFLQTAPTHSEAEHQPIITITNRLNSIDDVLGFKFLEESLRISNHFEKNVQQCFYQETQHISENNALHAFLEASPTINNVLTPESLHLFIQDGNTLEQEKQQKHFSLDNIGKKVLAYYATGGNIMPLSHIIRDYNGFSLDMISAVLCVEQKEPAHIATFLEFLQSKDAQQILHTTYALPLEPILREHIPAGYAAIVASHEWNINKQLQLSPQQIRAWQIKQKKKEDSPEKAYWKLRAYLTEEKEAENKLRKLARTTEEYITTYDTLVQERDIQLRQLRHITSVLERHNRTVTPELVTNLYDTAAYSPRELQKELEAWQGTHMDKPHFVGLLHKVKKNLEDQRHTIVEEKQAFVEKISKQQQKLLQEYEQAQERFEKQLAKFRNGSCLYFIEKGKTWLLAPEKTSYEEQMYEHQTKGNNTYITREEWQTK